MGNLPLGKFACEFTLELVRPPVLEREQTDGVTYLVARNYEMAYRTSLHFESGGEIAIVGTLVGDQRTGKSLSEIGAESPGNQRMRSRALSHNRRRWKSDIRGYLL